MAQHLRLVRFSCYLSPVSISSRAAAVAKEKKKKQKQKTAAWAIKCHITSCPSESKSEDFLFLSVAATASSFTVSSHNQNLSWNKHTFLTNTLVSVRREDTALKTCLTFSLKYKMDQNSDASKIQDQKSHNVTAKVTNQPTGKQHEMIWNKLQSWCNTTAETHT